MVDQHVAWPWDVVRAFLGRTEQDSKPVPFSHSSYLVRSGRLSSRIQATTEPLPARHVYYRKRPFTVCECPSAAACGDEASGEKIIYSDSHSYEWSYADPCTEIGVNTERLFDELLNLALWMREDVFQVRRRTKWMDWARIHQHLSEYVDDDLAPYAIIVDLSHRLIEPLQHVAAHPKQFLRRYRGPERIQRVRELDTACFIDLCRKPGMTVAEKAGPRQRLKAVRRAETIDILENRVALHTLKLSRMHAARYLDEYGHLQGSDRVTKLQRFVGAIHALESSPLWRTVTSPREPVRVPNYVLLENPIYREIWHGYQDLIRAEELRDKLWRWRRPLWASVFGIQMAGAIEMALEDDGIGSCVAVANRRVVQATYRFENGRFLYPDCLPGPYIIDSGREGICTLWFVDHEGLLCLKGGCPYALLNADYYIVVDAGESASVLPIYALDAAYQETDGCSNNALPAAVTALSGLSDSVRGVLIARQSRSVSSPTDICNGQFRGTAIDCTSNASSWSASTKALSQVLADFLRGMI